MNTIIDFSDIIYLSVCSETGSCSVDLAQLNRILHEDEESVQAPKRRF